MLIALSRSDINLLNEYSTLTKKLHSEKKHKNITKKKKLHSVQKCSDEDLILLFVDKRKLLRDFRDEFQQTLSLFLWIVRNENK